MISWFYDSLIYLTPPNWLVGACTFNLFLLSAQKSADATYTHLRQGITTQEDTLSWQISDGKAETFIHFPRLHPFFFKLMPLFRKKSLLLNCCQLQLNTVNVLIAAALQHCLFYPEHLTQHLLRLLWCLRTQEIVLIYGKLFSAQIVIFLSSYLC